jgi:acyl carrier protein
VDETLLLDWFRRELFTEYGIRKELVTPTADLVEDLGLDSIDEMALILTVEEEFAVSTLSDTDSPDYAQMRTIGDAIRYILRQLNNGPSPSDKSSSS